MLNSYTGKFLIIDLNRKNTEEIRYKESLIKFLGGRGFGVYLIYKNLPLDIDPLSPENILIIASGPLNGTRTPLASKVGFFFRSPLTGIFGESYAGGSLPRYPKWVGYDAVIIKGSLEKPGYITLTEDGVEFRDAKELWGLGSIETTNILQKEYGSKAAIVTIGPAGENLVRFACINVDKWRQAGRTGGGAVMGSKKLKAIVFISEDNWIEPANNELYEEVMGYILNQLKEKEGVKRLREYGTPAMAIAANTMGFFPTRYWSSGFFEKWENIGPEAIRKHLVHPHPCWLCPIACGRYVRIETRGGVIEMDGPEYETVFALGGLICVDNLPDLVYLNYLADDLGLDTISLGNVIGFAIEASKRKKIHIKVDYGNTEAIINLIKMIAYRRNEGNILAEGVARASQQLGLEDIAIHVKGLEPAGYDPRRLKGMILAYATSPRGACHLRMMAYYVDLRKLAGDPSELSERKIEKLVEFEDFMTAYDSMILCKFGRDIYTLEVIWKLYNAVTGANIEFADFLKSLSLIRSLIQEINIRMGVTAKSDTLPKRFLEEEIRDPEGNQYRISQHEVESAISIYYRKRGFNEQGIPLERVNENKD